MQFGITCGIEKAFGPTLSRLMSIQAAVLKGLARSADIKPFSGEFMSECGIRNVGTVTRTLSRLSSFAEKPQQDQKTHSHGVRRYQEFRSFRRNPTRLQNQKKLDNRKFQQKIAPSRNYVKPLIRLYREMGKVQQTSDFGAFHFRFWRVSTSDFGTLCQIAALIAHGRYRTQLIVCALFHHNPFETPPCDQEIPVGELR